MANTHLALLWPKRVLLKPSISSHPLPGSTCFTREPNFFSSFWPKASNIIQGHYIYSCINSQPPNSSSEYLPLTSEISWSKYTLLHNYVEFIFDFLALLENWVLWKRVSFWEDEKTNCWTPCTIIWQGILCWVLTQTKISWQSVLNVIQIVASQNSGH